ncbi:ABC-2 type transporter-domain-containing protein [Haematococcus lacustris]
MGASGAGKTSMLNLLAGNVSGKGSVAGSITVNGEKMDGGKMRTMSGFVHQASFSAEDVILDTMTVREALLFAAQLKLPNDMPYAEKERRAMDIAHLLNLRKSLDSIVGSALEKGISGGEKRRLSLGMEMVTNPSILFLDEPTSGLDSFTAYKVVRILSSVAYKYGRTIICTIHQPSSEVFNIFDDTIILAEGQVLFHGPVQSMVPYFGALGYHCPTHFNPADYLFMEVLHQGEWESPSFCAAAQCSSHGKLLQCFPMLSTVCPIRWDSPALLAGATSATEDTFDFIAGSKEDEKSRAKAREEESGRIKGLLSAWNGSAINQKMTYAITSGATINTGIHESAIQQTAGFWIQFALLAKRAGYNAMRNKLILKGKLAQTVFLSLIVGLIYLQLGNDAKSVQDRQGSLFFIVVQALFGSLMGVLTVFGGEKVVFQREYGSYMYGLPSYFTSRWLVELPAHIVMPILSSVIIYFMVGYQLAADRFWWFALILVLVDNSGTAIGIFVSCLFADINVALAVMPMFLMPLMIFSGFFVNSSTLGWWFRWISYISPMKYGFIALAKNEFSGLQILCEPSDTGCGAGGVRTGESVITLLGFDDLGNVGFNAGILFLITGGFLLAAYVALWAAVRRSHH